MKTKTIFELLAVLLISSILASACAQATTAMPPTAVPPTAAPPAAAPTVEAATQPAAQHTPVTLNYWTQATDPPLKPAVDELVKGFMAKYPWITVNVTPLSWDEYATKLNTSFAGGNAPDVFWCDPEKIQTFVHNGVLAPLTKYLPANYNDDWYPIPVADMYFNSTAWCISMHQSSDALLYNEDIIKAAGLQPPTSYKTPWTFEQFTDALKKVTKKNTDGTTAVWGFTSLYVPDIYSVQPLMEAQGTDFWDPTGTKYVGYMNSDVAVKALAWYQSLYSQGLAPVERIPDIFQTGKVAFYMANPFTLIDIQQRYPDMHVGVMPLPCGSRCRVQSSGWALGVPASSKHIDEAWLLIDYLTNAEGEKLWIEKTGYIPARKSVYNALPNWQQYPWNIWVEGLASYAGRRTTNLASPVFDDATYTMVQDVIKGADPKTELEAAAQKCQAEIDKYK